MPRLIEQIACYIVYSGDGSGSYDATVMYDEVDELFRDVKVALEHDRHILIEPTLMTRHEYEEPGSIDAKTLARFKGEA